MNIFMKSTSLLLSGLLLTAALAVFFAQEAFSAIATANPQPIITTATGEAVFTGLWDPAQSSGKCNLYYFDDIVLNMSGDTVASVTVSGAKKNGRGDFDVVILDQSAQVISTSDKGSTASSGAFTNTLALNPSVAYSQVGSVVAKCH